MPPNNPPTPTPKPPSSVASKDDDALFIVPPPPEPEPLTKGKLTLIIGITVLVILLVIGGVLFSLSISAKQTSYNYNKVVASNLTQLNGALKDLQPSSVLNRRDVKSPRAEIKKFQQNQISLSQILLGETLNSSYKHSAQLANETNNYYQSLLSFTDDMDSLVTFSDSVQAIANQEDKLAKLTDKNSSIALRSAAGSISGDADQIDNTKAPSELNAVKKQLISAINQKSKAYQNWAVALEKHKPANIKSAKAQISQSNKNINLVASDAEYAKAFASRYGGLQKQQADLVHQASL